ncbi:membrane protein [Heyndrickxia sporothermodurans]|nr:membrane protein [Heyndrickxia sporothermodurans]
MSSIITVYSIILTMIVYWFSLKIAKRLPSPFTSPVFLSTFIIIIILILSHVTYLNYTPAKNILTYLLGPATVSLAVPLYKNRDLVYKNLFPVFVGMITGTLMTITSAIVLGKIWSFSNQILSSLSIKSITIPVASEVSKIIGANEQLVAAFVMITGMFGAMFGPKILDIFKISHPLSRGLSLGTISHGIGTAEAVREGDVQGAISGVAMGVSAIFTSLIIPYLLPWLI